MGWDGWWARAGLVREWNVSAPGVGGEGLGRFPWGHRLTQAWNGARAGIVL